MKNFMNYSLAAEPVSHSSTQSAQMVRRLIRSLKSCQYFRSGQWTADADLAEHFSDAGKVVEACVRYHLVDVELVLQRVGESSGLFDMHLRLLDQPVAASGNSVSAAA